MTTLSQCSMHRMAVHITNLQQSPRAAAPPRPKDHMHPQLIHLHPTLNRNLSPHLHAPSLVTMLILRILMHHPTRGMCRTARERGFRSSSTSRDCICNKSNRCSSSSSSRLFSNATPARDAPFLSL